MKKVESFKQETIKGSACGTGGQLFTGALCASTLLGGPVAAIMFGPSCVGMMAGCFF